MEPKLNLLTELIMFIIVVDFGILFVVFYLMFQIEKIRDILKKKFTST